MIDPPEAVAADLLAALRAGGFRLRVEDGQLLISPAAKLSENRREQIALLKRWVVELLLSEGVLCPSCKAQVDVRLRCWRCNYRRCACGRDTGSCFIGMCISCQANDQQKGESA